jgi:hypothetical protein
MADVLTVSLAKFLKLCRFLHFYSGVVKVSMLGYGITSNPRRTVRVYLIPKICNCVL